jgi:uncharacterized protein (TIGR03437 family)
VPRIWLALAVLFCGAARGAAPSYSADAILTSASSTPGPFASNSLVTIYGKDLARSAQAATAADIVNNVLPTELNYTRVTIDNLPVSLLYVSDAQINLLIPPKQLNGPAKLRVVREGLVGPEVTISIVDASPGLFVIAPNFAIATHGDNNSLITPDNPASGRELIVIYCAGMGKTDVIPSNGELTFYPTQLVNRASLRVMLDGVAIDPAQVQYAGVTPGSAGLYQINIVLPDKPGTDPELRLSIAGAVSPPGVKLAAR